MIGIFIPSKDRAAQLDILLRSLYENFIYYTLKLQKQSIIVLYTSSSEDYENGYNKLKTMYPEVNFIRENGKFKSCFLDAISSFKEEPFIFGLTDDTVFYRQIDSKKPMDIFERMLLGKTLCFSLRLGNNTVIQNYENGQRMRSLSNLELDEEGIYTWDWTKEDPDQNLGYPISLDGHIYFQQDLHFLSRQIDFQNLREWEGNLISYIRKKHHRKYMSCFEKSYCVNVPFNMSQYPFYTTVGKYGKSLKDLNSDFLNGTRFDIDIKNNDDIIGSHQLLPLKVWGT